MWHHLPWRPALTRLRPPPYRVHAAARRAFCQVHEDVTGVVPDPIDLRVPGMVEDPLYKNQLDPKRCVGCGARFQSDDPGEHGYVPNSTRESFSGGRKKILTKPKGVPVDFIPQGAEVLKNQSTYRKKTILMLCQRCFRLQQYHLDTSVEGGFYRMEGGEKWKDPDEVTSKIVKRLRKESIVLKLIDITDFESSMVPELFDACRNKQLPVIFVVNKIDCLPYARQEERIKTWVRKMSRQVKNVHVNDVVLVSAQNGDGFNALEDRMRHYLDPNVPKTIYVVGRVNAGKSTFVNRFLWFVGYKHLGQVQFQRGVGGVTRSPVPGTTLNFVQFGLPKGFRLIDTPGIPSTHQITNKLTNAEDLYHIVHRRRIQPITHVLNVGKSMLVGALARFDHVSGSVSFVSAFFANPVTLHVCYTIKAEDLLERKATTFFYPPHMRADYDNLGPFVRHKVEVFGSNYRSWDDIVISGLGWISISGFGHKEFHVWVPKGVKVFRRPALMPYELIAKGARTFHHRERARSPKINRKKKAMVQALKDKETRDQWRAETAAKEEARQRVCLDEDAEDLPFVDPALEGQPLEV